MVASFRGHAIEFATTLWTHKEMDARIRKWRGIARRASLADGHWRIKVEEDPRQHHFVDYLRDANS